MTINVFAVKQEMSSLDGGRFVEDLSPSSAATAASYWTPTGSQQQLVACVVGHHGSTASSSSSFVDDESTSYEDITYSCSAYGAPSSAAALQLAAAAAAGDCGDYAASQYDHPLHPTHHQYGGYYDNGDEGGGAGDGYAGHQQPPAAAVYDDKPPPPPPPYDNNNAADVCDMNAAAYEHPFAVVQLDGQQVRAVKKNHLKFFVFKIPRMKILFKSSFVYKYEIFVNKNQISTLHTDTFRHKHVFKIVCIKKIFEVRLKCF